MAVLIFVSVALSQTLQDHANALCDVPVYSYPSFVTVGVNQTQRMLNCHLRMYQPVHLALHRSTAKSASPQLTLKAKRRSSSSSAVLAMKPP